MIIISKNKNCLNGFEISTVFNLTQHSRDLELIKKIQTEKTSIPNVNKIYYSIRKDIDNDIYVYVDDEYEVSEESDKKIWKKFMGCYYRCIKRTRT
jgi:hypothetical protein